MTPFSVSEQYPCAGCGGWFCGEPEITEDGVKLCPPCFEAYEDEQWEDSPPGEMDQWIVDDFRGV